MQDQIQDIYELSPMQQGMLFHTLFAPDSGMYVEQVDCRIDGPLNVPMFRYAWSLLLARHPVLRTAFFWEELEKALQIVHQQVELPFVEHDWREQSAKRQAMQLAEFVDADRRSGFALDQAPLLRCTLIRLANQSYHFVWTFHHLLLDGWSVATIFEELFTCYRAVLTQRQPALAPVRPYRDYIMWLQEQDEAQAEAYWRGHLQGFTTPTPLLNTRTRVADETVQQIASQQLQLPAGMTALLGELARQHHLTLNTLVQGAWAALLSRYSGERDIVFGATLAGRPPALPGVESMVGLFINTLPVRLAITSETRLLPWLQQIHAQNADLAAYAYSPLVAVQSWSEVPRGTPLFESIVVFENYPLNDAAVPDVGGLHISELKTGQQSNYPLSLVVVPGDELALTVRYDTARFDPATIERLLLHLKMLLSHMPGCLHEPVLALPMLTPAERSLLAVSHPIAAYPGEHRLHSLFEQQAARTPEAIALIFEDQRVTYAELDTRANQLAHHLRAQGVGPDSRVLLCLHRSPDLLVGLLGILKAGGAYVPLDPSYPAERLRFMRDDAHVAAIVTQQSLLGLVGSGPEPCICLDRDAAALAQQPTTSPNVAVAPEHLAYVIYTSGSTGQPKGVMIEHHSIVNHLHWRQETYPLNADDRFLHKASFSFDISVWECFAPWLAGGALVLASSAIQASPAELADLIVGEQVSVFHAGPALLKLLLEQPALKGYRTARHVFCGGEQLSPALRDRCFAQLPAAQLHHQYGPTETCVDATVWTCQPGVDESPVPIGRAIANLQSYLLDERLELVPMGVPGELYIGGEGVARGYLNRPDLTATQFIPNPFAQRAPSPVGARLYRTGDLGRYRADGTIAFLGRIDDQVKLRGFRIELGEIEATLRQHPAIGAAIVVTHEDQPDHTQLVAYVTENLDWRTQNLESGTVTPPRLSQWERGSGGEGLRAFLSDRLPSYMIPSVFIRLDRLPLTANGKVDRRALPAPAEVDRPALPATAAPRTPTEATLAEIWADVLRLPQVGIHDNFFGLGGDSILSLQIVTRARQADIPLTPRQLFQHQTIAELAATVSLSPVVAAQQDLVAGAAPLTPIQHRLLAQDLPRPQHYNQSLLLRVAPDIDPQRIAQALDALVAHHDALRLRFQRTETGWTQEHGPALPIECALVDLHALPAADREAALTAHATTIQASLDLTNGPLLRAALFHLADDQPARLLLVIHHLVVDGVSWRILLDDFATAYTQLDAGQAVQLSAKTTSYQRWAERLVAYAQSSALDKEQDYWIGQAARQTAALPCDHAADRSQNTVASAATVSVALSVDETTALLHEVPNAYQTRINDVLLTALAQTLGAWSGASAVRIDLEGHGREEIDPSLDLTRTVGWFTAIAPVVLPVVADDPGAALKTIKETLRALPQHGLGYGLLRYLHDEPAVRSRVAGSQAEVSFNYLGQFDQVLTAGPLLGLAPEDSGPEQDPQTPRAYLVSVSAHVAEDRLHVAWTYSRALHDETTIARVADDYRQALQALIAHCQSPNAGGFTPSDFPEAALSQQQLDTLLDSIAAHSEHQRPAITAIYPLTPMQQGMLFHSLYAPQSGVYVEQLRISLQGTLDCAAFHRAWTTLTERHAILRTACVWQDLPQPLQVVLPNVTLPYAEHDWRDRPSVTHESELNAWLQADRARGFALDQAPLARYALIRLSEETYHCVWTFHHVLLDGWSVAILLEELFALYTAYSQQQQPTLSVPAAYRDYIGWLQRQDLAEAEHYWRRTLQGINTFTPLTVGRAAGEGPAAFATAHQRLSTAATAQLQAFVREQRLTLNTLVQGAWSLLLSRYSGERDIVFGATVAGRPADLKDVERMVGLFINTLPVRVKLAHDTPVLAWLQQIHAQGVEMEHYAYSPLVAVQSWSEVPRGTSLFESIVVFENYPAAEAVAHVATPIEIVDVQAEEQTNFPLTLLALPEAELGLTLSYDSTRFDPATIERMLRHVATVLLSLASDPQRRLSDVSLLDTAEQHELMVERNATAVEYPRGSCLHELIEAQVRRTPDAIAVEFEAQQLTYAELDARANQLARYLQAQGIRPDTLVGICVERSLELVVGLLGILKAGGAYVPIDPSYPQDRLQFMLRDSQVRVLLTQERLRSRLQLENSDHTTRIVCLDSEWPELIATLDQGPVASGVDPTNAAYMIYTSGSTGQPKGAVNTHAAIINRLLWMQDAYGLSADDCVLQKTPFSFDVSVWEFFWPLLTGARLVVAIPGGHLDSRYLAEVIIEKSVTTLHFVPSMLQIFVEEPLLARCTSLRRVICSGEALPYDLQTRFFARCHAELHNLYGPTEAAVDVSYWACRRDSDEQNVPIGFPIANTQLYVLDRELRPVPVGVPGELFIGGVQLARGYHRRPDLTAEKFIPNPFSATPNARMYRTGDLARLRPDGAIDYLGRIDHQVKIRGFRIELGEIETALLNHPAVAEAVVVAREDTPGQKRLVAYIVEEQKNKEQRTKEQRSTADLPSPAAAGEGPGVRASREGLTSTLRAFLLEQLPDYMVPTAFVTLAALPLSSNGKIDRKVLPAPNSERPQIETAFVVPQTEHERIIAKVWQETLGVERVGIHDNFFELGGHSILMIQVHSQLHKHFGERCTLVTLFQHPTVHALAEYLSGQSQADPEEQIQVRIDQRSQRQTSVRQQRNLRRQLRSVDE